MFQWSAYGPTLSGFLMSFAIGSYRRRRKPWMAQNDN